MRAANAFIKEVGYDNIFMQENPRDEDIRRTIENIVLRLYEGRNIFGEYISRFKA